MYSKSHGEFVCSFVKSVKNGHFLCDTEKTCYVFIFLTATEFLPSGNPGYDELSHLLVNSKILLKATNVVSCEYSVDVI